jgi:hypothetical protein
MSGKNAKLLRKFTYLSGRSRMRYDQLKMFYILLPSPRKAEARTEYIDKVNMWTRMLKADPKAIQHA